MDKEIIAKKNRAIKQPSKGIINMLFLAGFLPVLLSLSVHFYLPGLSWVSEPLHSSMEAIGAFAAFTLAALLLLLRRYREEPPHHLWIAYALLAMGIPDLFHSIVSPGNLFVWLHAVAVIAGGFIFSLVWLPERHTRSKFADTALMLLVFSAGILGLLSIIFPGMPPAMIKEGAFTTAAKTLNVIGGVFFISASVHLTADYLTDKNTDNLVFATISILFGLAGLLFPFSKVWDAHWWLWHILRLSSYATALWHVFAIYRQSEKEIVALNESLERRVEERTMELTKEIEMRKLVERALHEGEGRLFQFFDGIPVGIFIVDGRGMPYYANQEGKRILGRGLTATPVTDQKISETYRLYTAGTDRPYPVEKIPLARALSGETVNVNNMEVRHPGCVIPIEVFARPIYDASGKIEYAIAAFRDIKERKEAEALILEEKRKLEEVNRELEIKEVEAETAKLMAEAANRAKSDFLSNMSHELRTPLNSIVGFSEVIEREMAGSLTSEQKEYIGDIISSSKHLLDLITDILDLSKIEAGKMELEPAEFNLKKLIEASLSMFREKALKHGIKIKSLVGKDIGNITADQRKIKQCLFNLLGNAVKFTPDGGMVGVAAKKGKDSVEISVEDTGIGISKEDQLRLFQPFQQLEAAFTKKYAGTGLGLSLCKKFVELHGGSIWVESEAGKGSKFTFTIPVRPLPGKEEIHGR